jgi:hypothetical protein
LQKWRHQKLILEQGILHFLAQERGTSANESSFDRDSQTNIMKSPNSNLLP